MARCTGGRYIFLSWRQCPVNRVCNYIINFLQRINKARSDVLYSGKWLRVAVCLPSQVRNWVKRQQNLRWLSPLKRFPEDFELLHVAGISEGVAVGEILFNPVEAEFQIVRQAGFPWRYRLLVRSSIVTGQFATNQSTSFWMISNELRRTTWSSNDLCHICKSFLASRWFVPADTSFRKTWRCFVSMALCRTFASLVSLWHCVPSTGPALLTCCKRYSIRTRSNLTGPATTNAYTHTHTFFAPVVQHRTQHPGSGLLVGPRQGLRMMTKFLAPSSDMLEATRLKWKGTRRDHSPPTQDTHTFIHV